MGASTEVRARVKPAWKVAMLALAGALGMGVTWHLWSDRTGEVIREIRALNGRSKVAHTIDLGIPGLRFQYGHLKQVDFLGPELDDAGLAVLDGTPRLQILTLTNTKVTDDWLARLAKFRDLDTVYLANIDQTKTYGPGGARYNTRPLAGGKGLAALKDLPKLQHVLLIGPGTSDEDVKALASLKHLRKINLLDTRVTDEGVSELKKALPDCFISRR